MDCNAATVLSLCSGAGGLELGLKLALPAAQTVCYVEGETYAAAILAARMEEEILDAAPVWSDVRTFDAKPWRGIVDIITAGYPCQPFSIAGAKKAEKDERHLWPYICTIVKTVQPRICFFENVSHHLRLGFEQVHDGLRSMGYGVAATLLTAEEIGAPHKRERLFILAYAEGAGTWLDQLHARQGIIGNGKAVANAAQPGLEGQSRHAQTADGPDVAGINGFPLWPPGPGEFEQWESVQPALKPALHRMADGMANRVDRIRLCGNGVVPLAAAYAWRILTSCIDE